MPSIDEPDPAGGTPVSADDDRSYNAVVTSPPQGVDPGEVWVTIPQLGQYRHGPCRFQPVPGVTPTPGQRCLVVKGDGAAEWWIVQFDERDVAAPDFLAADAALDVRLDAIEGQSKVAFPFAAGMGDLGAGFEGCSYSRHGRVVRLQGTITDVAGTLVNGDVLGTLPVGFRPTADLVFLVAASTSTSGAANFVRVDVQADGDVVFNAGSLSGSDWISLSGISFVID
jgi:hypothetical protein